MKRKLTSILLMSALLVGGASTFVSCKDYDGDQAAVTNANVKGLSDKLDEQIKALEAAKIELAKKADKVYVDDAINRIDGTIASLQSTLDAVKDGVAQNAEDIVKLNDEVVAVQADITAINTKLEANDKIIAKLESVFGENFENALLKGHLAEYAAGEGAEDFTGAMVASLNNAIAAANTKQFGDVFELFKYLDKTLPDTISALASKCALLAGQYSLLNDKIDSLVTGVNVDMVKNPIFGTLNTPFGLKSYVLAGFVGDEIKNTPFYQENGVWQTINSEEKVAASANGGSVYLTVNPSTINAEGWNIGRLVGRDGTVAPGYGKLVLAADNTPVTTRATNNLGGYVASAVFDNPAAAKINVNKDELADVAKNVLGTLRREENLNITNAVGTIYKTFANAIDQYYGINVKYGKDGNQSYTSSYDIAAVTIKPLSYNTLAGKGYEIKSIPQLQDILGIDIADYQFNWKDLGHVDDMTPSITLQIPDAENVTIDGSNINPEFELDNSKLVVAPKLEKTYDEYGNVKDVVMGEVEVTVHDGFVKIKDMDLGDATVSIGKKDTTITVTVKMDDFNAMIDNINSQVGGMMGTVNDLVDKIQGGFDKINNSVIARLNKVIAKANKILDNPNALLQPVMLYNDANGSGRLSESPIAPTRFNLNGKSEGAITLVATSYTGEMLAPAWKKHICVEGEGASVNVSGVIDGAQKIITLTAKPGKYTINYDAIDFYGKVRNKKYYVEVK